MASRWIGENGVEVEVMTLHGRRVYRVSKDDYFIAYCDTMDDVATFVSPDTLTEASDYGSWPLAPLDPDTEADPHADPDPGEGDPDPGAGRDPPA